VSKMMQTQVYYFSGTGNTYALAKAIASHIRAELISIPSVMESSIVHIDAAQIVVVFPCYLALLSGMPLMVERFVRKIDAIEALEIHAVCNCGGYECVNALPSLHEFERAVKSCGGKLHAAHSVRLPMNNLDYDHIPVPINRDSGDIIEKSKVRMERISSRITRKEKTRYILPKKMLSCIMRPFIKLAGPSINNELKKRALEPVTSGLNYHDLIPMTDKSIRVDEGCIGCGTCAKICPAGNIQIVNEKPVFLHRCEMCFACDEWCPTNSIHHWSRKNGVKYHHPDVTLAEMLGQKADGFNTTRQSSTMEAEGTENEHIK